MEVLYGLGIGLILAAILSVISSIGNGEDGDGGLGICACVCALIFAPFYVAAGILCMLGIAKWSLIASIVCNVLSILLHSYLTVGCFDREGVSYGKKEVGRICVYMMRVGAQVVGIVISIAAIAVAVQKYQNIDAE